MRKCLLILITIIFSFTGIAQNQPAQKPCSSSESSQFDFWVGNWELTWNDTVHGTNKVLKIMDGCTINENFLSPSQEYSGSSWSVYNPRTKFWQQTWVDNMGGYIALTGKFENNTMTLSTQSQKLPNGTEIISRMVFYDITPNNFNWKWESTTDNGSTWKTNWLIHYKRKPEIQIQTLLLFSNLSSLCLPLRLQKRQ